MTSSRRRIGLALSVGLLVGVLPLAVPAGAEHMTDTEELEASDNVGAAVAFSKAAFPDGATEAALGRDDTFPDSLASGLAQSSRPLLLTKSDALSSETKDELARLDVDKVYILGGTAAVSEAVGSALTAEGYTVQRISGSGRVETAVEVAKALGAAADKAIVARAAGDSEDESRGFADSLAAGGWAAAENMPVLLTDTESLSQATADYLKSSAIKTVFVVGGRAAVSDNTMAQLTALGLTVERVSGPTRFHTALAIAAKRGFATAADADRVILTEGQATDAWAAGFAAAALSKKDNAPIVLSVGEELPEPTAEFLTAADGDPAAGLVCSPNVPAAACDGAAEALGQAPAGELITFTSTSVARNDYVVGDVVEHRSVRSLTVNGCGYTGHKPYINEQGEFYWMLTEAQGTCSATFVADTAEGTKQQTVEFSIGDTFVPRSALQVPELVSVRPVMETEEGIILRFLFDEPIAPGSAIDLSKFRIQPAKTTDDTTAISKYAPTSIQRDPRNESAVLAVFRSAEFHKSTTAYVMGGRPGADGEATTNGAVAGAVRDIDGYANPTGHFGTRKHDLTASGSEAPELRTVGDYRASDSSVVFTFSEDVKVPGVDSDPACNSSNNRATGSKQAIGRAQLVLSDGSIKRSDCNGWSAGPDAKSLRVKFGGDGLTSAEFEAVRRAYVEQNTVEAVVATSATIVDGAKADQWNPGLGIVVASGGITPRPDFVNIENPTGTTTHTIKFVFEEDLDRTYGLQSQVAADRFIVVLKSGQVVKSSHVTTSPIAPAYDGLRKVHLSFGLPANSTIAYYGIVPDAVKAFNTGLTSFADAIAVTTPDVFLPGITAIADLNGGETKYNEGTCSISEPLGGEVGKYQVIFKFDGGALAATSGASGNFNLYRAWFSGKNQPDAVDELPRIQDMSQVTAVTADSGSKVTFKPPNEPSSCQASNTSGSPRKDGWLSNQAPSNFWQGPVAKGRVRYLEILSGAQTAGGQPSHPQGMAVGN